MSRIIDRMIAHADAPAVYDAPTPDELRVVARQWQAMEKALRELEKRGRPNDERIIKEALPK